MIYNGRLQQKNFMNKQGISFKQTDDVFVMYLNKNYEELYPTLAEGAVYKTSYRGVP